MAVSVPAPDQSVSPSGEPTRRADPLGTFMGFGRLLRIGFFVAILTMALDALAYLHLGSRAHLVFSLLAGGAALAVAYALGALGQGRKERAVAVPLVYIMLAAPVGPALLESRVLVSVVLPFIVMAVAVNFSNVRYVPVYAVGAWVTALSVFTLWQSHMVARGAVTWPMAVMTVVTASVIVAFAFYAFTRYSVRLEGAFQSLRSANEELSKAHTHLKGVNETRISFINSAAHELNTPLTPVRIQLELLQRATAKGDVAAAHRATQVLDRNFSRLKHLVGDLLDGARLDAGQLKIHKEDVDLSALVAEAAQEHQQAALGSGVRLEAEVDPDCHVQGDPLRLRQVLDNLVTNALKFTQEGGRVRIRVEGADATVRLAVADDGIGMDPVALAGLFQPFRQVHDPEKLPRGGSGLGLYITRGIVERHDGRIDADSNGVGHGTTFTAVFPRLGCSGNGATAPESRVVAPEVGSP